MAPAEISSIPAERQSGPTVSIAIINKDDPAVAETLGALTDLPEVQTGRAEVIVIDASARRLDHIRRHYPRVRWLDFTAPARGSSIPQQRNAAVAAARADIILFTDASCVPDDHWLDRMLDPLVNDTEMLVAGSHRSSAGPSIRDDTSFFLADRQYVEEAPTINLAFRRSVHEQLGGFDDRFAYGSDVDFTWRATEAGYRIRYIPDAIVRHDWGDVRAELRRSL